MKTVLINNKGAIPSEYIPQGGSGMRMVRSGQWMLFGPHNELIDMDPYRYDLAERNNINLKEDAEEE
jgi:hypothetical protein